jgi:siroheme synthase (precorrin-2 oxidase/ferrochelatase)
LEPQGGSKSDYRIWASDAAGVRFVYPYIKDSDGGTVQIFVESSDNGGIPSQSILDDVEEVINFDPDETRPLSERSRRPVQANLEVLPIDPIDVEINITGLVDSSTEIREAIELNLIAFLNNIRPFVDGADLLRNKNDILFTARLQGVVTDVLSADNFFNDFNMLVDGGTQTSFIFAREKIPNLINVNYL